MAFYSDFAEHYEAIFPLREEAVGFLDQWLPIRGRVLDVGCGTGGYCARLSTIGRVCEGVDPDPAMVEKARRFDPSRTYQVLGMEDLDRLVVGSYAGIYCIGNVLAHLSAERLAGFVATVHGLLRPGGVWVFQTVNFDPLLSLSEFDFPIIRHEGRGLVFHRSYREITDDELVFHTRLADRGGEIFAGATTLHPRTSDQYVDVHEAAGFTRLAHVSDWGGRAYLPDTATGSIFIWRRDD